MPGRGQRMTSQAWNPLPYEDSFSDEEFARLRAGYQSRSMEEKWNVDFEQPYLVFRRSWTGMDVFRIRLEPRAGGAVVGSAETCHPPHEEKPSYSAALLRYLTRSVLLGEAMPFPTPNDVPADVPDGVYQHMMVGRGGPEQEVDD